MLLFFNNGGVGGIVKKISKNRYLSVWRASFTYSYWKRPAMNDYRETLLKASQHGLVSAECFQKQGVRTWFSEKRPQIQILGLDSLLLRAYNPPPSLENWNWIWLHYGLLERPKNKATNKKILGLDSLLRQAYNPPSLSQARYDI